jgi:phosphoribosyl-ATP pyrophosphohydrolase
MNKSDSLSPSTASQDTLLRLADVIASRRMASPDTSYVARLFQKGSNSILKKVGEEAAEVLLAAKDLAAHDSPEHRQAMIGEWADLWFHSLVAMEHLHIRPEDVLAELARREGLSGLEEFSQRKS